MGLNQKEKAYEYLRKKCGEASNSQVEKLMNKLKNKEKEIDVF